MIDLKAELMIETGRMFTLIIVCLLLTCGTYSASGSAACKICPQGFSCSTDSDTTVACAAGKYSSTGEMNCLACLSGKVCSGADEPTDCLPGYTPSSDKTTCVACPAGKQCLTTYTSDIMSCELGTYSLDGEQLCTVCPPGFKCPKVTEDTKTPCSEGTYSSGKQSSCTECPSGSYCPYTLAEVSIPCPDGTYSKGSQAICTDCPAGSYCPDKSLDPVTCPDNTYSYKKSMTCVTCPAGYLCKNKATLEFCPAGSYSADGSSVCTDCTAGHWCPKGSINTDQLCPQGYYCETGAVQPVPCSAGSYGLVAGLLSQDKCTKCTAGYFCPTGTRGIPTAELVCPEGYYCKEGTAHYTDSPCPEGKYNAKQRQSLLTQCMNCKVGYYCPVATGTIGIICPRGHWCGAGKGEPTKCTEGTYTLNTGVSEASKCDTCPAGHYCEQGTDTPTKCPIGKFREATGGKTVNECDWCTAGKACSKEGLTAPDSECSPGFYCPLGTKNPGDTNETPQCPPGKYSLKSGLVNQAQCQTCPAGKACAGGQDIPEECREGHYCPKATTKPDQYACPKGTYTDRKGLTSAGECSDCPKGFYCKGGEKNTNDLESCSKGKYCPRRTEAGLEKDCPAGTYNNNTGLERMEDCVDCEIGCYCELGSFLPEKCPVGTYSDEKNLKKRDDCKGCEAGYECPIKGSTSMTQCKKGTYSAPNADKCELCISGHYCWLDGLSKDDVERDSFCPAGTMCPEGMDKPPSLKDNACPAGFYCLSGDKVSHVTDPNSE